MGPMVRVTSTSSSARVRASRTTTTGKATGGKARVNARATHRDDAHRDDAIDDARDDDDAIETIGRIARVSVCDARRHTQRKRARPVT